MRVPARSRHARRRRHAAAGGLLVSLATASCGGDDKPRVDTAALQSAWSAFARCAVGSPLSDGEKASDRMLRAELTQLVTGGDDWPASCSALSETLVSKLEGPGTEAYEDLRRRLGLLSGTTPDMYLSSDDGLLIDRVFEAAEAAGLKMSEGGDGPSAPPLASPASAKQRTKLGTSKSVLPRIEHTPGPLTARVVYATTAEAIACRIGTDPKVALQGVHCDTIDGEHGSGLAPVSSDERDVTYVWDDEPRSGIRRLGDEGKFFKLPSSPTAFVHDDGTIVDASMQKRKVLLARRLNYGKVEQAQLKGPAGGRFLGHRASVIVWRGPTNRITKKAKLVLQRIKTGRVPVGGERPVGSLDPSFGHPLACRAQDRLTIMVVSDDPLEGGEHPIAMVSLVDGDWTRLVTGRIALGKEFDWQERGHHAFQCTEDGGAFTWIRADGAIGQARCSQESCRTAVSKPMPTPGKTLAQRVATVGDEVLWLRAMQGKAPMSSVTEIVAMRMAPIDKLDEAPMQVLVGDEDHGGLAQVGKSLDVMATGPAAVALVRNGDDVYGIRIAPDGTLTAP